MYTVYRISLIILWRELYYYYCVMSCCCYYWVKILLLHVVVVCVCGGFCVLTHRAVLWPTFESFSGFFEF
jgi:hypothetical protein